MTRLLPLAALCATTAALAADPTPAPKPAAPAATTAPAKPVLKIIPGKVIVPTDAMRRPWGELISVDLKTRTGKFRNESNDEVVNFTVLPYSELLHNAAFGDLEDFRIGERVIFRLHQNESGDWNWLTYIQDQMNMMNGHKEYYYVDTIDAEHGTLTVTQANFDKSFVREKGIVLETDKDTHYWLKGEPAKFSDIKVGDKLRTKTHGVGKGKTKVCWDVFLDDDSLVKFQNEQKAAHAKRMMAEGLPGYSDKQEGSGLDVTLFQEGNEISKTLKAGQKVKVAPAGVDRKPTAEPISATVTSAKMQGNLCKVSLTLEGSAAFPAGTLARVWVGK